MTVREIVSAWLKENGYDGLYSPTAGCACLIADLMPCGNPGPDCRPGYRIARDCDPDRCPEDLRFCIAETKYASCPYRNEQ
jgi:hypothetical protein